MQNKTLIISTVSVAALVAIIWNGLGTATATLEQCLATHHVAIVADFEEEYLRDISFPCDTQDLYNAGEITEPEMCYGTEVAINYYSRPASVTHSLTTTNGEPPLGKYPIAALTLQYGAYVPPEPPISMPHDNEQWFVGYRVKSSSKIKGIYDNGMSESIGNKDYLDCLIDTGKSTEISTFYGLVYKTETML